MKLLVDLCLKEQNCFEENILKKLFGNSLYKTEMVQNQKNMIE
jgi:hypothetical protein